MLSNRCHEGSLYWGSLWNKMSYQIMYSFIISAIPFKESSRSSFSPELVILGNKRTKWIKQVNEAPPFFVLVEGMSVYCVL